MNDIYSQIYNWLKTKGVDIAKNDQQFDYGKTLKLIENLPNPEVVTEEEIKAISYEILMGNLECFYHEDVSGQKLSDLANTVFSTGSRNLNLIYSQLDASQNPLRHYLYHYVNADWKEYENGSSIFGNYTRYYSDYSLAGIVLDGKYKGHGVLVDHYYPGVHGNRNPLITDDGNLDESYSGEIAMLNFANITSHYWYSKKLLTEDIQQIEVEHYEQFTYLTVLLDGEETRLLLNNN